VSGHPHTDDTPPAWKQRELRFAEHLSDAEALMWNAEKDPWLNPSGATVLVLDRPIDIELFRRRMRWAVATVSRLRERIVPSTARVAPPLWRPDPEFDLDHHVRVLGLASPGTERQLLDLASRLYEDPYDRTRPLWQFTVVEGLEGGRGALIFKLHHTIADGVGAVRLSELYMELTRDAEPPPEVDLEAIVAEAAGNVDGDTVPGAAQQVNSLAGAAGHLVRRQLGLARRLVGEAAMWPADPLRPVDAAGSLAVTAQQALAELFGDDDDRAGGSPLWARRSRHRRLEVFEIDLERARASARVLGGTVNDLLLTGVAEAAYHYHRDHGVDLDHLNATFVMSTRDDEAVGGNSFSPARIHLPTRPMTTRARFAEIHELVAAKRGTVSGSGAFAGIAAVASRLPTSVISRVARQQAAGIDIATSNFRAAPFTVYVSGAKLLAGYPLGPVAGTACNLTAMSYDGTLFLGALCDPVAIADPSVWRDALVAGIAAVIAEGASR
jgi:diacylglycerol O-acyltransferase / wax synthase